MVQCLSQLRTTTSHRLRAVRAKQMPVNELRDESFVGADGTPTVKNARDMRGSRQLCAARSRAPSGSVYTCRDTISEVPSRAGQSGMNCWAWSIAVLLKWSRNRTHGVAKTMSRSAPADLPESLQKPSEPDPARSNWMGRSAGLAPLRIFPT